MRVIAVLALITGLAACGADGEPVQPTVNTGVVLSSSGAHVGTNVGLHRGPVSVNIGLGL